MKPILQQAWQGVKVIIHRFIKARQDAKAGKDFAGADKIRAELLAQGIVLEDSRQGTTWRRG